MCLHGQPLPLTLPPCVSHRRARRRRRRPARSRGRRARRRRTARRSSCVDAIPRGHKVALAPERRRAGPQVRLADRPRDAQISRAARTSTRTISRRCSPAWTSIDSRRARQRATAAEPPSRCRSWAIAAPTAASARATRSGSCAPSAASAAPPSASRDWPPQRCAGRVDGVYAFPHQFGCSQLGDDLDRTRKLIAALARHPNAGGVLILGLGCESNQLEPLLAGNSRSRSARASAPSRRRPPRTKSKRPARRRRARRDSPSATSASRARSTTLVVGLKCGGSDGFSGITANPLVGRIADRVTAAGGTAMLTEIPGDLRRRAPADGARGERAGVRRHRRASSTTSSEYFLDNDQPVHENPSPGNIAGGITTLEEKSLGAVQKGGHATVTQVLRYGERIDAARPGAARSAGQRRRLLDRAGRGRRDDHAVHDRPRHAARLSGADAEDQLELARSRRRKPHWIDFDAGTRSLPAITHDA